MNKSDFVCELARKNGITKIKASEITESILEILTEYLNRKEKIQFIGFGSFEVKQTPERMARNPQTREAVLIPRRYKAIFKQSPHLLDDLNGNTTKSK